MADINGLSCSLCFERYNEKDRVPTSLECGHTLCKACLIAGNLRTCPSCRTPISKPIAQLRPNYGLLQALDASGGERLHGARAWGGVSREGRALGGHWQRGGGERAYGGDSGMCMHHWAAGTRDSPSLVTSEAYAAAPLYPLHPPFS